MLSPNTLFKLFNPSINTACSSRCSSRTELTAVNKNEVATFTELNTFRAKVGHGSLYVGQTRSH